jgi:lipoate---protein ligase
VNRQPGIGTPRVNQGSKRGDDPVEGLWDLDHDLIASAQAENAPQSAVYPHPGLACIIGHGGDPWVETRPDLLRIDGVPLLRRRGGGCAVVLDPGNLVCSVAWPWPGIADITRAFAELGKALAGCLAQIGLPGVIQSGVSDLALDDRKIGGACIWRTRGLLYYSSTLLVDPDWTRIDRYLPHPPREPDYRAGRTHREFLTSLHALGLKNAPDDLASDLRTILPTFLAQLSV